MVERDREDLIGTARRIVAVLAIDDVVEVAALLVPEPRVERLRARAEPLLDLSAIGSPSSRSHSANSDSALYQSALISTALPRRGVTTQPSTFASIHVSWYPSSPCCRRPYGLLKQGEEGYQLTWMDAMVDGWVVTPRRGKAVEINALW